jgi:hypothetical protein
MTSEKPKVEAPPGWRVPDPAVQERLRQYEARHLIGPGRKASSSREPAPSSASAPAPHSTGVDFRETLTNTYFFACIAGAGLLAAWVDAIYRIPNGPRVDKLVTVVVFTYVLHCIVMRAVAARKLPDRFIESTEHLNRRRRWLAAVAGGVGWQIVAFILFLVAGKIVELGLGNLMLTLPLPAIWLPIVCLGGLMGFACKQWLIKRLSRPRKIFISYRRDDSAASAARIGDRLAQAMGRKRVFMDIDNLTAGQRFDKELENALAQCTVFIAVIGPRWTDVLRQRMQSAEGDYVRKEISAALKRGLLVVPVLVDGATLPHRDLLPIDIRDLVLHQKHSVEHERFGRDIDDLIDAIKIGGKSVRAVAKAR